MKKIIFAVVLFFICFSGFAQTGIYSGGLWSTPQRSKGLLVRPEVGVSDGFTVKATVGSQLTRQFFVGGGLGLAFRSVGSSISNGTSGIKVAIPLFANARCYLTKSLSAPFLELECGIKIQPAINASQINMYFSPAIGYDIKDFDIKVEFPNMRGVGFFIGYNIGFK